MGDVGSRPRPRAGDPHNGQEARARGGMAFHARLTSSVRP